MSHLRIQLSIFLAFTSFSLPTFSQEADLKLECRFVGPIEQLMETAHLKTPKRDAEFRKKVVEQYLKHLDPSKMYFIEADIVEITKAMENVFELIKEKDCSPLTYAYKKFVERLKERAEFAKVFLGPKYKFDTKAELSFDFQKRSYPKDTGEAEDFLKRYIHFQISNYLATDIKPSEARENVIKFWNRQLKKSQDMKNEEILAAYLDSVGEAMDPHSSYLSRDGNEEFRIQMGLTLQGIGASLSSQDGFTIIESLIPGGAAAKSGLLMPQDKILSVGQEQGSLESVIDMELRDVVKRIRGKKGTKVRLLIFRKDPTGGKRFEVKLVRDEIKLEDAAASLTMVEKDFAGTKKKMAVLSLPSFYADTKKGGRSCAEDLKKLLAEAKQKGAEGIILDLSTNPGGFLQEAVKISGLFLKTGNVVKQSSKDEGKAEILLKDTDPSVEWSGPLIVVTSRMSASASEIVAGTLKDYKRAIVVGGDHTYGKGTVQEVMDIPPQSGILGAAKVTVGMFFTAGGFSTQHRGVQSDISMPSPFELDEYGEKGLDYSLPPAQVAPFTSPDAIEKAGVFGWRPVESEDIKVLAAKSKQRVDKDSEFKKIIDELAQMKAKGKIVKVGEALSDKEKTKIKKEKAQALKNASKEEKKAEYLKRPEINEGINIMLDYLELLNKKSVANK